MISFKVTKAMMSLVVCLATIFFMVTAATICYPAMMVMIPYLVTMETTLLMVVLATIFFMVTAVTICYSEMMEMMSCLVAMEVTLLTAVLVMTGLMAEKVMIPTFLTQAPDKTPSSPILRVPTSSGSARGLRQQMCKSGATFPICI